MLGRLKYAFDISRFRFWIYTGGTYVIGYTLGAETISDFYSLDYYLYLFYFFFLANVFIYGVNDLFDMGTDEKNPKKDEKEERLTEDRSNELRYILYAVTAFSLVLMVFQDDWIQRLIFLGFLFLSYFYSARPLRFKSIPVADFSSNMLYMMPGIFGYYMAASELPPAPIIIAAFAHISAMHLFSAIPDIDYDRRAGIRTTAVVLKKRASLLLVLFFWSMLAVITLLLADFHPLSFLILVYPLVPLSVLISEKAKIEKVYWILPYINTGLGGLLFLAILFTDMIQVL